MLHARNTTHLDGESMVIKANRKHQIVLNMEVKRIEMEKKMRERYFCFEMSLMKARRVRILDRQKSLGIYRPHTIESGKDLKKARRTESFFFTQPVAMDSKVKLPPVSERRRTISGFPMKLANSGDSQITNKRPKNIDRNNILDKERAKRLNATEKVKAFEDGQSKNHSKLLTKESTKIDEIKTGNWVENRKPNNGEIGSLVDVFSKNLIIENYESQLQLDSKNLAVDNFGAEKERNVQVVKEGESSQQKQKENIDLNCNTLVQEFPAETSKPQFLCSKAEITSTQGQNISDLPSYNELQAWRKSWETRIINSVKDFKIRSRLKSASATGYGKDIDIHEVCAVKVRPQTALARLLKDGRKSS